MYNELSHYATNSDEGPQNLTHPKWGGGIAKSEAVFLGGITMIDIKSYLQSAFGPEPPFDCHASRLVSHWQVPLLPLAILQINPVVLVGPLQSAVSAQYSPSYECLK